MIETEHVIHTLTVTTSPARLEDVKAALRGPNGEIDFASIIPEPKKYPDRIEKHPWEPTRQEKWRSRMWGTDDNADRTEDELRMEWSGNTIRFQTSSSSPNHVITKLSKKFFNSTFILQSFFTYSDCAKVSMFRNGDRESVFCQPAFLEEIKEFRSQLKEAISYVEDGTLPGVKTGMEKRIEELQAVVA